MGGKALIQPPALDPVSLSEAKAHCRIDIADDDGLIAGYLLAARQHVEKGTGRALITQRWNLYIDRCWPRAWDGSGYRQRIVVPLPPLRSVISVQYVDTNGATQTLAPDQYRVVSNGMLGFIEPAFGVSWPAVRSQGDAITVLFEAGYGSNPGDVPEPLRHAILLHVESLYDRDPVVAAMLERARDALMGPYLTGVGV